MGFLDMLTGANEIGGAQGYDINRADFEIKDADKLFGQTQDQYTAAVERAKPLEQKRTTLLDTLEQSALGTGPSLAKEQLKQSQDRNLAQQLAMVQGQRGGSASANTRNLLRAQSEGAAQVANQGVTAGIQEQQANRQLYTQALGNEQQAVDAITQQYLSMGLDIRQAQQQALEDYNALQVQQATQIAGINAQNQRTRGEMTGKLVGGIMEGGAKMAAKVAPALAFLSDRNAKKNIQRVSKEDLQEMRKHLKAYSFEYVSNENGNGQWVGVMAQDLEKSKLGSTLVVVNSKGEKMIDISKVMSLFLATLAD